MPKARTEYGITRIDQPDKKNHGFYVRIKHDRGRYYKFFTDKSKGGRNKALAAAKAYRDKVVKKLPKAKREAIASFDGIL